MSKLAAKDALGEKKKSVEEWPINARKNMTNTTNLVSMSISTDCQNLGKCWEKCNCVLAPLMLYFHRYLLLDSIKNKIEVYVNHWPPLARDILCFSSAKWFTRRNTKRTEVDIIKKEQIWNFSHSHSITSPYSTWLCFFKPKSMTLN